jgi:hypothetical protein
MNNLWTFGDSFTESYNPKNWWSGKYIEWKGYVPKVYGEVIAEELGYNLINKGLSGSSNQTILETICNHIDEINPNDIVIIGWSSPIRFRIVDEYDKWQHMIPSMPFDFDKIGNVSANSIIEVLDNRCHRKYCKEVNSWIKLINKSLPKSNIIHWKYHIEKINAYTIPDLETINNETHGVIRDGHYSEKGQLEVANKLIHILKTGYNKTLI